MRESGQRCASLPPEQTTARVSHHPASGRQANCARVSLRNTERFANARTRRTWQETGMSRVISALDVDEVTIS